MVRHITVVGGTHGNEWLGPLLVKKFERNLTFQNGSLPVSTLLANPKAYQNGIRFIDRDLNRCFNQEILSGSDDFYEHQRAREIHHQFGTLSLPGNFIIDLHSTTSNMGLTLILCLQDQVSLRAAAYVQQHMPQVRLIQSDRGAEDTKTLNSISEYGLTIEVGPVPNNVIRHDLLEDTERMISLLIEYLEHVEQKVIPSLPDSVNVYRFRERVQFPLDSSGHIVRYIHCDLQDTDFNLLKKGDYIFCDLNGNSDIYEGEPGYPIFINEAAYYFEKIAFVVTDKIEIEVP